MSERLLSVGLDVGTTSTQMILSELAVENKAGSFSVPEMEIAERKILYKSPVHFTPLRSGDLVDAAAIRELIGEEYRKAGILREQVDTGAIIITGETSRKENAEAVLHELSGFAGDFVVATAGPDLESRLAAKGAGAVRYSEESGKAVLHMDIGGGTSNLALVEDGKIVRTGCLNVGGRLLKLDKQGRISYISSVLDGMCSLRVGEQVTEAQAAEVSEILVKALEMAAGLREKTDLLDRLWTKEHPAAPWTAEDVVISFSGGVADCIERERYWLEYGDIGPVLGRAIRESRLCKGAYVLGSETIRATVIGAGCHSAQLSGSTVFYRNVAFPLKNVPVVEFPGVVPEGETAVLAMPGAAAVSYSQVREWAEAIARDYSGAQVLVCMEQDMAKALGQALALRLRQDVPVLCIDRVRLTEGCYLDVGALVGPALPVVVKTLVLER